MCIFVLFKTSWLCPALLERYVYQHPVAPRSCGSSTCGMMHLRPSPKKSFDIASLERFHTVGFHVIFCSNRGTYDLPPKKRWVGFPVFWKSTWETCLISHLEITFAWCTGSNTKGYKGLMIMTRVMMRIVLMMRRRMRRMRMMVICFNTFT